MTDENVVAGIIFWLIVASIYAFNAVSKERLKKKIDSRLNYYMPILQKKYRQLTYTDDYGKINNSAFRKELNYFLDNVFFADDEVIRCLKKMKCSKDMRQLFVDALLKDIATKVIKAPTTPCSISTPYEYENYCADILSQYGWNARATQKSSDQGIDVVAEKGNKSIAIQCKLYSQPVGNKAVQEAYSGKSFYETTHCAVVTNSTFTKSARQLASNCGVLLLHTEDLKDIDSLL